MATQLRPIEVAADPLEGMSLPGWLYFDPELELGGTRIQKSLP